MSYTIQQAESNLGVKSRKTVDFLLKKPGYLKWGDGRLAEKLNVPESAAGEAKEFIRDWYNLNPITRELELSGEEDPSMPKPEVYKREEIPDDEAEQMDNTNENKNRAKEEKESYPDMSLEEYCEYVGLDFDLIDPHRDVKYWQTMKGERRYTVVPRVDTRGITKEQFIQDIRESVKGLNSPTPSDYNQFNKLDEDIIGLLNPTDAHLDKLGFIGKGKTLQDNIDLFLSAFITLLQQLKAANCGHVYFVVGSDLWNTNDARNTTKRGTKQENNSHYRTSYKAATRAIIQCVNMAQEMGVKVTLVIVEGNHDEDKVFHLGITLRLLYESHDSVEVLYGMEKPRQYIKWGRCMLGIGHGYHERKSKNSWIPLMMAEEAPKMWGDTDLREFFLGDIHNNEEYSFLRTKDFKGCRVRFLRDIGQTNSDWDIHKGYHTFPKSAEAFVFHKKRGQIANFSFNL